MFLKRHSFFEEPQDNAPRRQTNQAQENGGLQTELAPVTVTDIELSERLAALREMNTELNSGGAAALLDNAEAMMSCDLFRVGVTGCHGSGRRTVINSLLESEVIPNEDMPDIRVTLRSGDSGRYLIKLNNRAAKTFPLTDEGKKAFSEELRKNSGLISEAEVFINSDFLKNNGMTIELCGGKDYPACSSGYDCVVMVLLADHLMSGDDRTALAALTELSPRIVCAVNRMDLLATDRDKEMIVQYGDKAIGKIAPHAEIIYGTGGETHKLRQLLTEYRRSGEHTALKSEIVTAELARAGALMADCCKRQLEALEEREALAQKELSLKRSSLEEETRRYSDELETELLKRCARRCKWLTDKTEDWLEDVTESLIMELEHTGNPKDWWETVLPYKYKVQMKSLGKTLEANLTTAFRGDMEWLNSQIQKTYGARIETEDPDILGSEYNPALCDFRENSGLQDIKKLRITSRVIAGSAMVLGYIFLPTAAIACGGIAAASLGGAVASEMFLNKNLEQQKSELKKRLPQILRADIDARMTGIEDNVKTMYKTAFMDAIKELEKALDKRKKALEDNSRDSSVCDLKAVYSNRLESLKETPHN